jgi:hypothetical protein
MAAAAGAVLVASGLAGIGPSVRADEARAGPPPLARLAAVGSEAVGSEAVGSRHEPRDTVDAIDLRLLLAQGASVVAADPASSASIVLASFDLTTPHQAEADIARELGLVLVDWKEHPGLGFRVVRFRIPDGRPIAPLIERLRADRRVRSAQTSVPYRPAIQAPDQEQGGRSKAAITTEAKQPAGQPKAAVHGAGAAANARAAKGDRLVETASAPALRWLTADEPFVGADGRLR